MPLVWACCTACDSAEQSHPLLGVSIRVAEPVNGDAIEPFHDEVWLAGGGRPRRGLGDVGLVHEGQGLRSTSKRAITCFESMPA